MRVLDKNSPFANLIKPFLGVQFLFGKKSSLYLSLEFRISQSTFLPLIASLCIPHSLFLASLSTVQLNLAAAEFF